MTNHNTLENDLQVKPIENISEKDYAKMAEEKIIKMQRRFHGKNPKKQNLNPSLTNIQIIPGQLHNMVDAAQAILVKCNPGLYQRSGRLVRIVPEPTKSKKEKGVKRAPGSLVITEADPLYITEILGKLANWTRFDERRECLVQRDCPLLVAKTLIARMEWNLPILTGIIQAPILRPDGSILQVPGYDEETCLVFDPGPTIFPTIPQSPTKEDAKTALDKLLFILAGFPFENEESKSVAVSSILTGLIRKSIRTAPLHGFSAPIMGSGKSLLADVVGLIATGKPNAVLSQAADEAEEQKRLMSILLEGDSIVCYDNIERPFGSAALCSALTQEYYKSRILGITGMKSAPSNATFLATGNNLTFVGDISTRALLCCLDPQCERPEERSFDIDLREYIPPNRGELVQAALTILRAYHVAGRPKQPVKQYGRFEEWSDWVRSAIVWLEMEDPCASRKEIENADPVRVALGTLLDQWFSVFDNLPVKSSTVIKKAEENSELKEALLELASDIKGNGISERSLGKKLATFKNRIENGYRLETCGTDKRAVLWRVRKI